MSTNSNERGIWRVTLTGGRRATARAEAVAVDSTIPVDPGYEQRVTRVWAARLGERVPFLDDTVGKFLPDVRPDGKKAITVKHLLSMSSSVHNLPDFHLRDDLFKYSMFEAPMDHKPGEKWEGASETTAPMDAPSAKK